MHQNRAGGRRKRTSRKGPFLAFLFLCIAAALGLLLFRVWNQQQEATETSPQPDAKLVQQEPEKSEGDKPVAPENTTSPVERRAQEILKGMTLREQVCQLFIVTPEGLTGISGPATAAGRTTQSALENNPVGGLIYFANNLVTPEQTMEMIQNSQSYSKLGLLISVDEEGGTVSRLGRNTAFSVTKFSPMGEIGDDQGAFDVGATLGRELSSYGFNLDFAPVADVNTNPSNSVIGSRAFSSDGATAAQRVAAAVRGFHSSGMLCALKHFPGHGDTATDSHSGYAQTNKTWEELMQVEMLPFLSGIREGADLVMVGHIAAPRVTGDQTPASLSYEMITNRLRGELGFTGVVCTDAMNMGAIFQAYTSAQAAVKAIQAGVDILLMPEDLNQAVQGLLDAVNDGTLTQARIQESVLRILELKLENGIIPLEA